METAIKWQNNLLLNAFQVNKFKQLKNNPYWGNYLWSKDYCVDTVGLDGKMVRRCVKYQEDKDKREEKNSFKHPYHTPIEGLP